MSESQGYDCEDLSHSLYLDSHMFLQVRRRLELTLHTSSSLYSAMLENEKC